MSTPRQITPLRSLQYDFATSIAQALWAKAKQITDYTNAAVPVGMLLYVYATQTNLPSLPDSKYWQLCDGSVVTNSLSPMVGQTLPDLRGVWLKHPAAGSSPFSTGGTTSVVLTHSHTGQTESASDRLTLTAKAGGDFASGGDHQHDIAVDLVGTFVLTPPTQLLQIYVRIV